MKVSTVLTALFASYATVLPRLTSAHPRDFERRQVQDYCDPIGGCSAPDAPCCTDSKHGAYCQNGRWVLYPAPGGCQIVSGSEIVATFNSAVQV
jgi:hypothetical protein